jgi:hypothetical protein
VTRIKYTRWEVIASGFWLADLVALVAVLGSKGKTAAIVFLLCFLAASFAWDLYTRRRHPEFYAEDVPSGQLMLSIAAIVALGLGCAIFFEDARLVGLLLIPAALTSYMAVRHRDRPDPSIAIGKEDAIRSYEKTRNVANFLLLFVFLLLANP